MTVHITCIKRGSGNNENSYTAIFSMNWLEEETQKKGTTSPEQLHDFIMNGGIAYVKGASGRRCQLEGKLSGTGMKYVQTKAGSVTADDLLQLPECESLP